MTPVARAVLKGEMLAIAERSGRTTDALAGIASVCASIQVGVTSDGMGITIRPDQEKRISEVLCEVLDIEMRVVESAMSAESRLIEYLKMLKVDMQSTEMQEALLEFKAS